MTPERAAAFNRAMEPQDRDAHDYISTACHHGLHQRCRQRCKFCDTPCRCDCHGDPIATDLDETLNEIADAGRQS